jgi:hypothetical protein
MNPTFEALKAPNKLSPENVRNMAAWVRRRIDQDSTLSVTGEDIAAMLDAFAALQAEQGQEPQAYQTRWFAGDGEGWSDWSICDKAAAEVLMLYPRENFQIRPLFAQPTPPAEQWVSVKERLPVQEGNCLVYPFPTDYCVEARLCFDGQWRYVEYETGFGEVHHVCSVTHWMPFPNLPPIDSTDAGDKPA